MSDTREAVARVIHAGAVGKGFRVAKMAPEWMPFLPEADAAISAHLAALEADGFVVVRRADAEKTMKALGGLIEGARRAGQQCAAIREAMRRYGHLCVDEGTRPTDPGAAAMRDHL